jgi:hypothetical protein
LKEESIQIAAIDVHMQKYLNGHWFFTKIVNLMAEIWLKIR